MANNVINCDVMKSVSVEHYVFEILCNKISLHYLNPSVVVVNDVNHVNVIPG